MKIEGLSSLETHELPLHYQSHNWEPEFSHYSRRRLRRAYRRLANQVANNVIPNGDLELFGLINMSVDFYTVATEIFARNISRLEWIEKKLIIKSMP